MMEHSIAKMQIAAVFATMNRKQVAAECLTRLMGQSRTPEIIVIVDNASADGTADHLREIASDWNHGTCVVLGKDKNLGNAGGVRLAFEEALSLGAGAVWILDDDSWPEKNSLAELLSEVPSGASVLSSIVLVPETDESVLPSPETDNRELSWPLQILVRTHPHPSKPSWKFASINELPAENWFRVRRSWLGALIPAEVYRKVGPINEALFLRGEDEDYPRRLERLGLETWLCRKSVLRHPRGANFRKVSLFGRQFFVETNLKGDKLYYRIRNMLWVKKTHSGLPTALIWAATHFCICVIWMRPFWSSITTFLAAVSDAFCNRLGRRRRSA